MNLRSQTCKLGFILVLVLLYFLVELIVGHIVNSLALIGDSFHMLSDFIALIIGIVARRVGKLPKSKRNSFGWQRAEVVGTLINIVLLIGLTFSIVIEAFQKFYNPESVSQPLLLLYVGGGGLVINVIGMIVMGIHGHSHGSSGNANPAEPGALTVEAHGHNNEEAHGHGHNNEEAHGHGHNNEGQDHSHNQMNMRAVFLHILADFFGSVAVVISALVLWLVPDGPNSSWKLYVDPSISLVIVILIVASSWSLLRDSIMILLQSVPKEVDIEQLENDIYALPGVESVHDFHVWRLHNNVFIASIHVVVDDVQNECGVMTGKLKSLLHNRGIHCTTIQVEKLSLGADCAVQCIDEGSCKEQLACCPSKTVLKTEQAQLQEENIVVVTVPREGNKIATEF